MVTYMYMTVLDNVRLNELLPQSSCSRHELYPPVALVTNYLGWSFKSRPSSPLTNVAFFATGRKIK